MGGEGWSLAEQHDLQYHVYVYSAGGFFRKGDLKWMPIFAYYPNSTVRLYDCFFKHLNIDTHEYSHPSNRTRPEQRRQLQGSRMGSG